MGAITGPISRRASWASPVDERKGICESPLKYKGKIR